MFYKSFLNPIIKKSLKEISETGGVQMKQIKKRLMAGLLLSVSLVAWSKGNVDLKNEAFKEVETVAKDGNKIKNLVPATQVVPGEEVLYVITYQNKGKEAATDVVITNPIPKNMTYKAQEAEKATTKVELSVDGGKKWGNLAELKIQDKLRKFRPALPSDVTHVRWIVAGSVLPNEESKVRLRAVLN